MLWFITQWQATQEEPCEEQAPPCPPGEIEWLSMDEFRNVGRSMRLTRMRDGFAGGGEVIEGSTVWHDYDGDEIYGDLLMAVAGDPQQYVLTPTASHEPGIGTAIPDGDRLYHHGDQIGSTREITGAATTGVPPAAEVTARMVYTAFGERIHADGSLENLGRHQYAGAWGYQSGLYEDAAAESLPSSLSPAPFIHVGHRWYDPSSGRFLQRDPIGIRGGPNVYAYALGRPTNLVDPLGLWTFGFEFELSINFGCFGFKLSYGIHAGYSRKRGVTHACHGSASANIGPGKGFSIGPEVVITTADSAHDLSGTTGEINVNLGAVNLEGLMGTTGGWDGEPTRPYFGLSAGIGIGSNVGVNIGGTGTTPGSGNSYPIRGPTPGL